MFFLFCFFLKLHHPTSPCSAMPKKGRDSKHLNHKFHILQVRMRFWTLSWRLHRRTKCGGPTSAWATTTAQCRHQSSAISWRTPAGECPQMILRQKTTLCLSWLSRTTLGNVMTQSNVSLIGRLAPFNIMKASLMWDLMVLSAQQGFLSNAKSKSAIRSKTLASGEVYNAFHSPVSVP